jgi:hypothetical protein
MAASTGGGISCLKSTVFGDAMPSTLGRVVAVTHAPAFTLIAAAIVVLLPTTVTTLACASCPVSPNDTGACACANEYTVNPAVPLLLVAAFGSVVAVSALWYAQGTSPLAWVVNRPRLRPRGGASPP